MDFQAEDKTFPFKGYDAIDAKALETFEYEYPGREIALEISTDEFTCVCPFSGLPDFGTLLITYVPDKDCIELRSLKYYLLSYRHVGIFYEHLVNRVLDDLVAVCKPVRMTVQADYAARGGIKTKAAAKYEKPDDLSDLTDEEGREVADSDS